MDTSSILEELKAAQAKLDVLLPRLRQCAAGEIAPDLDGLMQLLTELARPLGVLRGSPSASQKELIESRELARYRSSLEEVHHILPAVQGMLFTYKAQLESARAGTEAAAAWMAANKTTL